MRLAGVLFIAGLCCSCAERDAPPGGKTGVIPGADTTPQRPPSQPGDASGDTIMAERYADGGLSYLALARDSGDCKELHQSFYRNGRLKSYGCQGRVENAEVSTGMSVGTWTYLDSISGRVDSTFFYDNSAPAKAFILKKIFYPDGRIKAEETWNNYILYESEPKRKGVWKYYAENGKLLRTQRY